MLNARFCFLLLLLFSIPACSFAAPESGTLTELFAQANSDYQKGDFESALLKYRRILDSGAESGPLYYNLGNTCFKQKKLGEAIFYWEKARRALPADVDIRQNLELANLMITDRIEASPESWPARALSRMLGLLSAEVESRIVLALFVAANIFFSIFMLSRSRRIASGALIASLAAALLFVIFAASLSWKIYQDAYRKEGIITEQKVDVLSGPGPENVAVFTLHEGMKVRIHEAAAGWRRISLPNGWNGWVPQGFVRIL